MKRYFGNNIPDLNENQIEQMKLFVSDKISESSEGTVLRRLLLSKRNKISWGLVAYLYNSQFPQYSPDIINICFPNTEL